MPALESVANRPKRKNSTTSQKRGMIAELLKGSSNDVLLHWDHGAFWGGTHVFV